jgi:hypothetical protein
MDGDVSVKSLIELVNQAFYGEAEDKAEAHSQLSKKGRLGQEFIDFMNNNPRETMANLLSFFNIRFKVTRFFDDEVCSEFPTINSLIHYFRHQDEIFFNSEGMKIADKGKVGDTATATMEELSRQNHEHKQRIIPRLRDALNVILEGMPQETLDEKKKLADFANATLAAYGLAVKCPKTGLPAKLVGDVGNLLDVGRFQIYAVSPDGKRHRTSSETLPKLDVVEVAPPPLPSKGPEESWVQAVGPKAGRSGRPR